MKNKYIFSQNLRAALFSTLLIAFFIGCGAGVPFTGSPQTGVVIRYWFEPGQTLHYSLENQSSINTEMMGEAVEMGSDIFAEYTLEGRGRNSDGDLLIGVTVDTMKMEIRSIREDLVPDLSSLIGKSFGLVLSPTGEVMEYMGTEDLFIDLGQMMGGRQNIKDSFRNIFISLPEQEIKIGDSWTENGERMETVMGMEVNSRFESINRFEAVEEVDGMECLKFTTKKSAEMNGEGERMGTGFVLEGNLDVFITWYFAYRRGILVKMEIDTFLEGNIAVGGGSGMTIPVTSETTGHVRLTL